MSSINKESTTDFSPATPTSLNDSGISSSEPSFKPRQLTPELDLHEIFHEIGANSIQLPVVVFDNVVSFADFATLQEQRLFHFLAYDASSKQVSVIEMPSDTHESW